MGKLSSIVPAARATRKCEEEGLRHQRGIHIGQNCAESAAGLEGEWQDASCLHDLVWSERHTLRKQDTISQQSASERKKATHGQVPFSFNQLVKHSSWKP